MNATICIQCGAGTFAELLPAEFEDFRNYVSGLLGPDWARAAAELPAGDGRESALLASAEALGVPKGPALFACLGNVPGSLSPAGCAQLDGILGANGVHPSFEAVAEIISECAGTGTDLSWS